jgi:hypothetical protein
MARGPAASAVESLPDSIMGKDDHTDCKGSTCDALWIDSQQGLATLVAYSPFLGR